MKNLTKFITLIAISMMLFACVGGGGGSNTNNNNNESHNIVPPPSNNNDIYQFSLNNYPGNIFGQDITVSLPNGTNITNLIAVFSTYGESVTVNGIPQINGETPNNFESPVIYTVYAADGSTKNYTVFVIVESLAPEEIVPSENKAKITEFYLNGIKASLIHNQTIHVIVPKGTDITNMVAAWKATGEIRLHNVVQRNGVTANDFTTPQNYFVYAPDGSVFNYAVTVTIGG